MKHSKTTKAIALLMSMTMITSVFVGNTLSRYVTSVSSTDSARVAVWGINAGEDTVMNLFDTKYIVDGKEIAKANDNGDSTFDKIMAPGTSGEAPFSIINFEQNVAPEVAYEVKISLDDSTIADEIKNNPSVQWKLDNNTWGTWDQLKTSILSLSGNAAGRHVYGPGEFATAFQGTQEHKIAWQWILDNENNVMDTEMGNLALTNDLNAVIKVSITAQQIDDLITNGYILEGANQIVSLNDVKPITIRSSADFSTFEGVEVEGQPLTRDVDYTAESGSTVVTLNEEYLSKLAIGTYTIDIISTDITATTTFIVVEDSSEFVPDVPENQGVANALRNFKQLEEFSFTPRATMPSMKTGGYKAGSKVYGMPYSSSRIYEGYSPNFISFETFMSAVQNPYSYLYTIDLSKLGNENGKTYYGIVCSSAVGYALNIGFNYSTHQWKYIPGMEPLEEQSVSALKLGDTISNNQSGHVVMVTGITRNGLGEIGTITISEAAHPNVQSVTFTPEEFATKYYTATETSKNHYVYYRYNKIAEVKYTHSEYLNDNAELYNTDIIPRKGDKSNWLTTEPVEIDLFNANYSNVEVYKDDSLLKNISLNRQEHSIDYTIPSLGWEIGGLLSTTGGNNNSSKNRARTGFIPSVDVKITKTNDTKLGIYFYDSNYEYISWNGSWIIDTNTISIKELAPINTSYIRIITADNTDSEITDINAFTSNFKAEIFDNISRMPIVMYVGGLNSADGTTGTNQARGRSDLIPKQNYKISVDPSLEYLLYYYDKNKNYLSYSGIWSSADTNLFDIAPNSTEYFRIVIKNKDGSDIYTNIDKKSYRYNSKINLSLLGGGVTVDGIVRLENLEYGSYKARLTDGTNHSDWCYWIVVDPVVTAVSTGNEREVKVDFSVSNAEPLFVKWAGGIDKGAKHINVLTEQEKNAGSAIVDYISDFDDKQEGKYHIRVAFKTEYGIIHSELGPVIDVN